MARRRKQVISGFVLIVLIATILTGAMLFAEEVLFNENLQSKIVAFGYVGITLFATIAGLNVFIPIPAASFTPVFTAANLSLPLIILSLTIGTLLADFIGYLLGHISRDTIATKYPKVVSALEKTYHTKQHLVIPLVFIYAAFIPIPNEAVVIPLAFLGSSWKKLMPPLFLGNLINQTLYAIGFNEIFKWLI